jgi:hypothetical protein
MSIHPPSPSVTAVSGDGDEPVQAPDPTDKPTRSAGTIGSPAQSTLLAVASFVGLLVVWMRAFRVGPTFDLFYDEILYEQIGHSVDNGGFPRADGHLFFLHPPAFFYLEAAWQRLLGTPSDLVAAVYQIRVLNSLLAGVSAFLLVLLVPRVGSALAGKRIRSELPARVSLGLSGGLAGVLFALDPYTSRINGKVLLETSAMMWVLLGYLVLMPLIVGQSRRPEHRAAVAGTAFGLAILTKDLTLLVTVFPLWMAGWQLGLTRRLSGIVSAGAVAPYTLYVILVALSGDLGDFWDQKSSGVRRLLGFVQISGFHEKGAPSLVSQLLRQLSDYGTTYALLLAGLLAALMVWHRGSRPARYLAVFYFMGGITLAYATLRGALEEQFLYLLITPAIIMVALVASMLRGRRLRVGFTVFLIVLLGANVVTYVRWHDTRDDGFAQVRAYMLAHLSRQTPVIVVDETGRYALQDDFRVGTWTTDAQRSRVGVRYIVVPWREVEQGYTYLDTGIDARTVQTLLTGATRLVSVHGRSYGDVALYRLPSP